MLKELFAKAAGAIFEAADDIPQDMAIRRSIPGVYNPATGKTGPATVTDFACKGIVGTYKQNEITGTSVLTTDRKVTVRQAEVAGAGVVTTSDKLVIGSTTRTIVNVQADAASILWTLQAR